MAATFGDRLAIARKKKGLTQWDMATALNISQGTYAGYEGDNHKPDIETLARIADLLDVTTDLLLGRMFSASFKAGMKSGDAIGEELLKRREERRAQREAKKQKNTPQ